MDKFAFDVDEDAEDEDFPNPSELHIDSFGAAGGTALPLVVVTEVSPVNIVG